MCFDYCTILLLIVAPFRYTLHYFLVTCYIFSFVFRLLHEGNVRFVYTLLLPDPTYGISLGILLLFHSRVFRKQLLYLQEVGVKVYVHSTLFYNWYVVAIYFLPIVFGLIVIRLIICCIDSSYQLLKKFIYFGLNSKEEI